MWMVNKHKSKTTIISLTPIIKRGSETVTAKCPYNKRLLAVLQNDYNTIFIMKPILRVLSNSMT